MRILILAVLLTSSILYAKINTVVSILPQQTFVKAIGGDKVNITLMVQPGNSPHTYEPRPSQMKEISQADLYLSIGVEFEKVWLDKFKNQNQNMKIVNISKGIKRIAMKKHSHGHEENHEHEAHHDKEEHHEHEAHHDKEAHHEHEAHHENHSKDPHIWTSPKNVKVIAHNIYKSFIQLDYKNKDYYKTNLENFLEYVNNVDKKIKSILKQPNKKFMVFHPSWGYFSKDYKLVQIPIEIEGKNPKPKELIHIISEAREENISAIFISPEFSNLIAKQIANELKIPVIKISPLNKNWGENLENFANAIANNKG